MMRMSLLGVGCASVLLSVAAFRGEAPKRTCCAPRPEAQQSQGVKVERLRCSLTGQVVDACCCVQREGKMHCTLAGKDVPTCCCHPFAEDSKQK